MTKYTLTRANKMTARKKVSKRRNINLAPFCVIFLIIGLMVSGASYLNLLNEKATYGYKVSTLEKKVESLKEFNQKLELERIELEQNNRLEEIALNLEMVKSESVDFLISSSDSVAVR